MLPVYEKKPLRAFFVFHLLDEPLRHRLRASPKYNTPSGSRPMDMRACPPGWFSAGMILFMVQRGLLRRNPRCLTGLILPELFILPFNRCIKSRRKVWKRRIPASHIPQVLSQAGPALFCLRTAHRKSPLSSESGHSFSSSTGM